MYESADESDEEEEEGQHQQPAAPPASRISTSMVNQATAHLQKNGRYINTASSHMSV